MPRPSFAGALSGAWHEARALVREHAVLAVLEAQRAGLQFAVLVGIALAIGVLLVTAWLTAIVAGAIWLLGNGASWATVLLSSALANVAIAVALGLFAKGRFAEMPFAATLRQFSAGGDDDE